MGLLEYDSHYSGYDSYVSSGLPSPTSPHPSSLLPSPSSNIHFTFPSLPYPDHAIKEEPSPWTVPSLDLPSTSLTSNDHFPSSSPMLLSPAVSNLNTPRVSLSSTRSHGSHPDLSSRLRSSHSSLHSASASPLPYSDSHCPGTFGHSVSQYSNEQGNFMELSPPNPLTSLSSLSSRLTPGCVTPPRSGFSSPLQVAEPSMLPYHPAPPSYEQAVQQQYPPYMEPPPPPYNAFSVLKSDPNLYCPPRPDLPKPEGFNNCLPTLPSEPHTPDPDSLLSDCGPDTPDSSIKEEPSEEASEGTGVLACKWRNCGREFTEKKYLVDHVTSSHIEQRKGCDDFPCFWEACPRRLKPFNAKYKLLTHMRVHTGEKPYVCREGGCNRSFARLENLKIHNRSHTGEKPFLCKFAAHNNCNKAFSNSSDRAKHEQTHRDPKPYKCDVPGCQKRYTDPSSLRKHVKNHSREEQEQAMALARQARESEACQQSEVASSWADQGPELRQGDPLSPSLGLMAGGGLVGYSHYPAYTTPPQYRRAPEGQEFRRGEMHHQPNSLDSVEGDALPFDSVPIRFDGTTHEGYEWS